MNNTRPSLADTSMSFYSFVVMNRFFASWLSAVAVAVAAAVVSEFIRMCSASF